jgi:hypothetical protein
VSPNVEARAAAPAWLLPLLLGLLFALQVHAYRWGVITPDTVEQYGQALSGTYDDWHPPATAWLWRQLLWIGHGHIGGNTAPILLFDGLLYWVGIGLVAEALRRRGARLAMGLALLSAALPIPFGQMGAILKDPLLAACCLAAAGLLLFAGTLASPRARAATRIAAVLLLILGSATRINALFATSPLLLAIPLPPLLKRPSRAIPAFLAAATLLAASHWLIDSVALQPHRSQPFLSLVNFDLGGIVAQGGGNVYPQLDDATARRMTALCYHPGLYNPHDRANCNAVEETLAAYAAAHHRRPVALWLGAIGHAPLAYARHRLAHLNRNWRFLVADVPNDAVYAMTTPNPFGLAFTSNRATVAIGHAAHAMALSPLGRPATWLAVALGLLVLVPRLPHGRFTAAASLSALCYGGGYALVSVAPDMRYNLWTMLAAMLALTVALADLDADRAHGPSRRRLLAASAPALCAASAEMAWLAATHL